MRVRGPRRLAVALLLAGSTSACGGTPAECVEAARLLAPAVIAFVDGLPAGIAATGPVELRGAIDERDGRTLDQLLLEANRMGLGGIDPAPGQDPSEVSRGLGLARDAGCEIADLRPTLADEFAAAAEAAEGETARRYEVVSEALRPEG